MHSNSLKQAANGRARPNESNISALHPFCLLFSRDALVRWALDVPSATTPPPQPTPRFAVRVDDGAFGPALRGEAKDDVEDDDRGELKLE